MINKLAKFITHHPKSVILVATLLLIPSIIGYAGTFVNYDILSYLPEELDSVKGEVVLDETFHNASMSMLLVEDMPAKYTHQLKEKVEKVDGVSQAIWVDDIADISIPQEALPDVLKNVFYSQNGDYTMMLIQYTNSGSSVQTMNAIKQIKHIAGKQCFLSGMSAITTDTKTLADEQAPIYIGFAILLALIAMTACMESWLLPLILLLSLIYAVVYNMGTNIFLGQISYITQCIAAILQLGVTMDYSVFLIDRYEEEKQKYPDRRDAMAKAISGAFLSLIGSSATTIFGFIALCFMRLTLGRDIGIVMAKGVLFGIATVIIVLPAFILTLDKPIHKYRHRSLTPHFEKVNDFILKHKRALAVLFLLIILPSYWAQTKTNVYYNLDKALPQDLDSIVSLNKLKDEFNMATTHFVIVDDTLPSGKLCELEDKIEGIDGVTTVLAYNKFIGYAIPDATIPDSIKEICKKDGKQLLMINSTYSAATDEENKQIAELTDLVKSYDETALITGEGVLTKDLIDITDYDFKVTSAISILAIFVIIAISFKSISIPVFLITSIELAIIINKAFSFMLGTTIPFIAPTVIGCVQLGATVDYAILLTTRFKEEIQNGHDRLTAMKIAANSSDRSIFQSALVFFCATFGVYLICDISIIKSLCAMLARGSVISALVIIFLLKPILLICEKFINKTSLHWRTPKTPEKQSKEAISS